MPNRETEHMLAAGSADNPPPLKQLDKSNAAWLKGVRPRIRPIAETLHEMAEHLSEACQCDEMETKTCPVCWLVSQVYATEREFAEVSANVDFLLENAEEGS